MNRNKRLKPVDLRAKPARKAWAHMIYRCEKCHASMHIGLENTLERHNGKKHKPVPFTIKCRNCGEGLARDVSGLIPWPEEKDFIPGQLYFVDDPDYDCGVVRRYC